MRGEESTESEAEKRVFVAVRVDEETLRSVSMVEDEMVHCVRSRWMPVRVRRDDWLEVTFVTLMLFRDQIAGERLERAETEGCSMRDPAVRRILLRRMLETEIVEEGSKMKGDASNVWLERSKEEIEQAVPAAETREHGMEAADEMVMSRMVSVPSSLCESSTSDVVISEESERVSLAMEAVPVKWIMECSKAFE